jgi:ketosteroid isomerase-like protein
MKSRQWMVITLVFLATSVGAAFGQTSSKAADAVRAADEAWEKVYAAKDLDKSVAFLDDQASIVSAQRSDRDWEASRREGDCG